jgi:tetratricopeptide (TPR) repeat protein
VNILVEAEKLMEQDQVEEAISLIQAYAGEASDEELFSFSEFFIQWGFLVEAEEILRRLLVAYPEETEIKLLLTDIYIEQEKDEEAIELLNSVQEDDESYLQVLVSLADLYQAQALFEVAEQKLLKAKEISPGEPIIDIALGELYYSLGDYKRAITFYEKSIKLDIPNIPIHERLAESYANVGEYELALTFYEKSDSKNPDFLYRYGFTAHQADRMDIAINVWKELLQEDPDYHTAYLQLAKAYEEEEMIQEAYNTALAGIKKDEFNKELYFVAGHLAHQLGDDTESEERIREAISLDSDYKEAVLFLVEIWKEQEQYEKIIDLISNVKDTGGDDPLYDWELARAYHEIESYNDALNSYKDAYNSLQHDSDFLKEYGYFLTEEGRVQEAIHVFEAYLEQDAQDDEILEYVQRLKEV